ncbi:MAG: aldo/keto reductase [Candidatus Promineofilum sp.]|nr:aldo/keto reductase [Promineifilum sp.]
MKRNSLGDTGLPVTPMGLGLAALGRPGYINLGHAGDLARDYDVAAMTAHAHAVLDAAWRAGIRYFDAARSYGRAEEFLSGWLRARRIAPGQVAVGSKWGYTYTAGWQVSAERHEIKDHSLPVLRRQIDESRALLGDYLGLYQIHSATLDSGVLDNEEVLAELARLRDGGLVIGLSLSGPNQADTLRRALAIDIGGAPLFRSVQATWNVLAQEAGPALAEAHNRGMGVIVKEALANGRLTDRNDDPAFTERRRLLSAAAAETGVGLDTLALAAVLVQPWADVVLSGAARAEHLASNVAAVALADRRRAWLHDWLRRSRALAEPAEVYWRTRAALAWN